MNYTLGEQLKGQVDDRLPSGIIAVTVDAVIGDRVCVRVPRTGARLSNLPVIGAAYSLAVGDRAYLVKISSEEMVVLSPKQQYAPGSPEASDHSHGEYIDLSDVTALLERYALKGHQHPTTSLSGYLKGLPDGNPSPVAEASFAGTSGSAGSLFDHVHPLYFTPELCWSAGSAGIAQQEAVTGQVLAWDGEQWAPSTTSSGGGSTGSRNMLFLDPAVASVTPYYLSLIETLPADSTIEITNVHPEISLISMPEAGMGITYIPAGEWNLSLYARATGGPVNLTITFACNEEVTFTGTVSSSSLELVTLRASTPEIFPVAARQGLLTISTSAAGAYTLAIQCGDAMSPSRLIFPGGAEVVDGPALLGRASSGSGAAESIPLSPELAFTAGSVGIAQQDATNGQALVWSDADEAWVPGSVASSGSGGSLSLSKEAFNTRTKLYDYTLLTDTWGTGWSIDIPGGYDNLEIVVTGRASSAGTPGFRMHINGDTTETNYHGQYVYSDLADLYTGADPSSDIGWLDPYNAPAGCFSTVAIRIPDYASSRPKTADASSFVHDNGLERILQFVYRWTGTAAITSLSFAITSAGNFVAGSRIQVYGTKETEVVVGAEGGALTTSGNEWIRYLQPTPGGTYDGWLHYQPMTSGSAFDLTDTASSRILMTQGKYRPDFFPAGDWSATLWCEVLSGDTPIQINAEASVYGFTNPRIFYGSGTISADGPVVVSGSCGADRFLSGIDQVGLVLTTSGTGSYTVRIHCSPEQPSRLVGPSDGSVMVSGPALLGQATAGSGAAESIGLTDELDFVYGCVGLAAQGASDGAILGYSASAARWAPNGATYSESDGLRARTRLVTRYYGGVPGSYTQRANGSEGAEAYLSSGNAMGSIGFQSWNGTGYSSQAYMLGVAAEDHDATHAGAQLDFYTTADATTTAALRARLASNGNWLVGTTSNDGRIVAKSDGVLPALVLQAASGANTNNWDASGNQTTVGTISGSGALARWDVNPVNLIPNGGFDAWTSGSAVAPDGWVSAAYTTPAGAHAVQSTSCVSPPYGVRLGDGAGTSGRGMGSSSLIPVTPGASYMLSLMIMGGAADSNAIIGVRVYDANGTIISGSAAQYVGADWLYSVALDEWYIRSTPGTSFVRITRDITLASSVYYLKVFINFYNGASYVYVDDVQLTRGSLAPPFQRKPLLESYSGSAQSVYDPVVFKSTITAGSSLDGPKSGFTDEGGYYITAIAGEALARGEVVQVTQGAGGADGKVYKIAVDSDMPIGAVYAAAAANASVKVVVSGIAYVLPNAADTAVRGDVIYSSGTTAGRVSQSASAPAATTHFREIGHWLDTGSGAGALTRAIVHFN